MNNIIKIACLTLALVGTSQAATLVNPTIAYNSMGSQGSDAVSNLVQLTDLTPTYVSGVTDSADYLATNPGANGDSWRSSSGNETGYIIFDLGSSQPLGEFILWNVTTTRGINGFTLTGGNALNGGGTALSGPTVALLSDAAALATSIPNGTSSELFTFTSADVRYVQLTITSNHGANNFVSAKQVAFGIIPEPTSAALVAGGLGLLLLRRRRD